MMALARMTLGLQQVSPCLFTWQLPRILREHVEECKASWAVWSLQSGLFYWSKQVTSQPRFKQWETLQTFVGEAKSQTAKKFSNCSIFTNNLPQTFHLLCSLLCPKHIEQCLAHRSSWNISWTNEWIICPLFLNQRLSQKLPLFHCKSLQCDICLQETTLFVNICNWSSVSTVLLKLQSASTICLLSYLVLITSAQLFPETVKHTRFQKMLLIQGP